LHSSSHGLVSDQYNIAARCAMSRAR
jgi:hypothetical protein